MKYFSIFFLFVILCPAGLLAQESTLPEFDSTYAAKLGADAYGNCTYTFVMLSSGDSIVSDKVVRDSLFQGHMKNMVEMAKANKLLLAGPFYTKNAEDFRGIFIFDSTDTTEVKTLLSHDPAISNGLLKARLYPWYGSAAIKELNAIHKKIQKTGF